MKIIKILRSSKQLCMSSLKIVLKNLHACTFDEYITDLTVFFLRFIEIAFHY